jgi:hypothetical protein
MFESMSESHFEANSEAKHDSIHESVHESVPDSNSIAKATTASTLTLSFKSDSDFLRTICAILIFLGILSKFYGINEPWKTHDHYNFGGVWTTSYAECLKQTPIAISRGIPLTLCWTDKPSYYPAHPPTVLIALAGWTQIFGNAEWAYRLFFLIFSTLNILLLFKIARIVRPIGLFPWLAAALQSTFLGGIYFGTHPDFIGEFTVFFILLTALLALKKNMTTACLAALAAGISSWPGYIVFAPLLAYSWLIGKGRKRVMLFGVLALVCAMSTIMWLHQTFDIIDFLKWKLLKPGYVKLDKKGWLEPLNFIHNIITSLSRLLGPLFFSLGIYSLVWGEGRGLIKIFKLSTPAPSKIKSQLTAPAEQLRPVGLLSLNKLSLKRLSLRISLKNYIYLKSLNSFHHAVLLCGGMGVLYTLIGHEYMMVHVFLYLFWLPAFALLGASWLEGLFASSEGMLTPSKSIATTIAVTVAALYPFGIFKSNIIHDAINSAAIVISILIFVYYFFWREAKPTARAIAAFLVTGFLINFSQTANYRNEPDTERSFCEHARKEYEATGRPVHAPEASRSDAKSLLYCAPIYGGQVPIVYDAN